MARGRVTFRVRLGPFVYTEDVTPMTPEERQRAYDARPQTPQWKLWVFGLPPLMALVALMVWQMIVGP